MLKYGSVEQDKSLNELSHLLISASLLKVSNNLQKKKQLKITFFQMHTTFCKKTEKKEI